MAVPVIAVVRTASGKATHFGLTVDGDLRPGTLCRSGVRVMPASGQPTCARCREVFAGYGGSTRMLNLRRTRLQGLRAPRRT